MNGKNVKVYSLANDGNKKLSANFRVREFRCQDGTDAIFIDPALVELLQAIRDHFGQPVNINSAYRTPQHNAKPSVGGERYSRHLYGTAADIKTIKGTTPAKMAAFVETLLPNTGGIGTYSWGIHVDTRAKKARWRG